MRHGYGEKPWEYWGTSEKRSRALCQRLWKVQLCLLFYTWNAGPAQWISRKWHILSRGHAFTCQKTLLMPQEWWKIVSSYFYKLLFLPPLYLELEGIVIIMLEEDDFVWHVWSTLCLFEIKCPQCSWYSMHCGSEIIPACSSRVCSLAQKRGRQRLKTRSSWKMRKKISKH